MLKKLLGELSAAFITEKRHDGEEFMRLADGHPRWMLDVVHACHDEMLPDDTRYRMIHDIVWRLEERIDEDMGFDSDELQGIIDLVTDDCVDIYNTDRARWLASHLYRANYVDQALAEYGQPESIWDLLAWGQLFELREIAYSLVNALEEHASTLEEASDDEP